MAVTIRIRIGETIVPARLEEGGIADAIAARLPLEVGMSRWGEEYYGAIGLGVGNDAGATEVVDVGTIAYWPPGDALCFFFGPTPASVGDEPRAASAVTVVGTFEADAAPLLRALPGRIDALLERA